MKLSPTITAHGITGFLGREAAPRELECLLEIAAGKTSKQVARGLGCTSSTVKKAVERIFFKLHVSNRAALIAEAFRCGLIQLTVTTDPEQRPDEENETVFLA